MKKKILIVDNELSILKLMIQKTLVALLFLLPFIGKSQTNYDTKQAEEFRVKLNQFKYSLYPDLIKMNPESINDLFVHSDTLAILYTKCKQCYTQNAKARLEYQKEELAKHANNMVDMSHFSEDTSVNKYITDFGLNDPRFIFKYLSYNPIEIAQNLMQVTLSQMRSPSEMGVMSIINILTQPLIATKKIDQSNYEIIIDKYQYAFVFNYDLDSQSLSMMKMLKRKE